MLVSCVCLAWKSEPVLKGEGVRVQKRRGLVVGVRHSLRALGPVAKNKCNECTYEKKLHIKTNDGCGGGGQNTVCSIKPDPRTTSDTEDFLPLLLLDDESLSVVGPGGPGARAGGRDGVVPRVVDVVLVVGDSAVVARF